ncbi:basic proline-rich protein-like [Canis lupus familiaris]|uniref:basic proline-rich protein-like n=1 Tax=Canis lupus familiaris TaxID=9615 RepID=UPI0018F7DCE6|nr:basic proline-rich protein-like [Canis lupus familiaris]
MDYYYDNTQLPSLLPKMPPDTSPQRDSRGSAPRFCGLCPGPQPASRPPTPDPLGRAGSPASPRRPDPLGHEGATEPRLCRGGSPSSVRLSARNRPSAPVGGSAVAGKPKGLCQCPSWSGRPPNHPLPSRTQAPPPAPTPGGPPAGPARPACATPGGQGPGKPAWWRLNPRPLHPAGAPVAWASAFPWNPGSGWTSLQGSGHEQARPSLGPSTGCIATPGSAAEWEQPVVQSQKPLLFLPPGQGPAPLPLTRSLPRTHGGRGQEAC